MSEGRGGGGGGGGSGGGGWRWIQCQRANVGQGNAATFDEDWGRMRRCEMLRRYTTPLFGLDLHAAAAAAAAYG
ncbi:hypothetical protein NCU10278 [Neurospora crassa OR74A]|uniref:Uncharacterized protein n=1 Tax=Neurospora crassa (strain ATCC 24698 / 74-OR23-1A / CBS 708.71 / DSM 1257 / FGSC 987) TaxID=367110 RepID=A7UXE8_NEUCR|nr:hypothetical protein NCU10278 [Neurospora crassa OR74A]EDO64898.1 hypothetical protein NCU10278 [Neurospora crassa OR74A]|eukprot:XP_001727989.1 hypothetical protein NCU10278 [Neurospora crassa OR74A]